MFGFSSRASRVSASASWISRSRTSPEADRARCKRAAAPSSGMGLSFRQANRHSRRGLGWLHMQRDQTSAWRNSVQRGFDRAVKKSAPSDRSATFRDRHFAILHIKFLKHAGDEFGQRFRRARKYFAGNCVALISQISDQRKDARENVIRIFYHPVEHPAPVFASQPMQHFLG